VHTLNSLYSAWTESVTLSTLSYTLKGDRRRKDESVRRQWRGSNARNLCFEVIMSVKVKFDLWRFLWRFQSAHIPKRKFAWLKTQLKTLWFQSKFAHGYFNEPFSTMSITQMEDVSILKSWRFQSQFTHGYFNGLYLTTPIWIGIFTILIVISIIIEILVDRNRHEKRQKSNFTYNNGVTCAH
jgi:hypothetical protein